MLLYSLRRWLCVIRCHAATFWPKLARVSTLVGSRAPSVTPGKILFTIAGRRLNRTIPGAAVGGTGGRNSGGTLQWRGMAAQKVLMDPVRTTEGIEIHVRQTFAKPWDGESTMLARRDQTCRSVIHDVNHLEAMAGTSKRYRDLFWAFTGKCVAKTVEEPDFAYAIDPLTGNYPKEGLGMRTVVGCICTTVIQEARTESVPRMERHGVDVPWILGGVTRGMQHGLSLC